ncbi:MAG: hypothetical protein R2729_01210 [Bryobacteraceae bacterium]
MKNYVLKRGPVSIAISELKVDSRPLVSLLELERTGQVRFSFACEITPDQKTIIGGFKSMSGMDSETEVTALTAGNPAGRLALVGWRLESEVPVPQGSRRPGRVTYSNVTLKRG